MTKYKCGYDKWSGCGATYELSDDREPWRCPVCECIYCYDCGYACVEVEEEDEEQKTR